MGTDFNVVVSGTSTSVSEWTAAMNVPKSEVPKLDPGQKEVARKFGVSEEDYARSLLASELGQKRLHERSRQLGLQVQHILEGLGSDYRVSAVIAEMMKGRWNIRVASPEKVVGILVPRELGDDVLDSGDMQEVEKLRVRVLSALGREDLIVRR